MALPTACGRFWARNRIWAADSAYTTAVTVLDPLTHCAGWGWNLCLCSNLSCCSQILNLLCQGEKALWMYFLVELIEFDDGLEVKGGARRQSHNNSALFCAALSPLPWDGENVGGAGKWDLVWEMLNLVLGGCLYGEQGWISIAGVQRSGQGWR